MIYQDIKVWSHNNWWWAIQHRTFGKHFCWWKMTKTSSKSLERFDLVKFYQRQPFLWIWLFYSSLHSWCYLLYSYQKQHGSHYCHAQLLVIIDTKVTAKSRNVLIGRSSFFNGTFLTMAMKSMTIAWVCGGVSGLFLSMNGRKFSNTVPSCDLTL